MAEFRMPSLGADMEAGTLVEWLVKPGDQVKRGDVVAVVETQKGAIEVEIYQSGQIEQLLVDLDTKVPVGTPLARLRGEGEVPAAAAVPPVGPAAPDEAPAAAVTPIRPAAAPAAAVAPGAGARASPAARRLAEQRGIDLSTVTGSGPGGAVTYDNVEGALGKIAGESAPVPEKRRAAALDLGAMRTAIAAAMARSKREIPHYYLEHQVDVTASERWLTEQNASRPPDSRLLMGALAIKAVALAARRFPAFNGFHRDNKFEASPAVHVGVAIAVRGGGLAAPALHDADQLSLDELMGRMRDLVQRTRAGRIRSSENLRSNHHGVEPWGAWGRSALWHHLSTAGHHCRHGQGGGTAVGCRRRCRSALCCDHDTVRRPPRHRWTCGCIVLGRDRQALAGAGQAMSDSDVRKVVQEELGNIAPEIDFATVDPAADLREAIDINSMDFLNFITSIHRRLSVDIPEVDYPKLITLDGAVAYIKSAVAYIKSSAPQRDLERRLGGDGRH